MSEPEARKGGRLRWERTADGRLLVHLSGRWTGGEAPPGAEFAGEIASAARVEFDAGELGEWDSSLPMFLAGISAECRSRGIEFAPEGLPEGVRRLLTLATAVPEARDRYRAGERASLLALAGNATVAAIRATYEFLTFTGEALLAFGRFLRGKATYRRVDLLLIIQECGAQALPIVTLISVLVGTILSFVGAYQLKMFGAEIFIAAGVGLGMVREMAPMMTGIIMAGRTGAAFAAQIGTMEVNEEIDAFRTMGISPMEFLVLPRMLALGLMMPLLCLYSDLVGMAGGALVGTTMFSIPLAQYIEQTRAVVGLNDVAVGVFKSAVFGVVIAMAGCMKGMKCGRSASAVGDAATSAVVTGIVAIIALDSLAAVITTVLDF